MRLQRPPAVTFVAVTSMVFGIMGILCACWNGSLMAIQAIAADDPDPMVRSLGAGWQFVVQNLPAYVPVEIGLAIYQLVAAILAIVAGIGLLSLSNWGRVMSLIYSFTMIAAQFGSLVFFFAFVSPLLNRGREQGFGDEGIFSNGVPGVICSFIALAYAIVVVILLFLPSVSAAFAGRRIGRFPEWDEDPR